MIISAFLWIVLPPDNKLWQYHPNISSRKSLYCCACFPHLGCFWVGKDHKYSLLGFGPIQADLHEIWAVTQKWLTNIVFDWFFFVSYSGLEISKNIGTQWEKFHVSAFIADGFWAKSAYFQLVLKLINFIVVFSGKFVL